MKNIAFIINPIAGTINKRKLPKVIEKEIDSTQWATDIVFTEYKGHATELAAQYARLGFDAVVAVGGDGTVSEVARGVRDTQTALGIIPIGSGNGLARHLNIPLRVPNAIHMLNHSEPIVADYGLVDDEPFFCTCGSGFDAYISEQFAKAGKRGFKTYLEHIIKDIFTFEPDHYHIVGEDIDIESDAFLVTCANCNQWGNAAIIAPQASLQDGKMDIVIVSRFPLIAAPSLAIQLFTKTIDKDVFINTIKAKEITLYREKAGAFHYDGDPCTKGKEIHIRIVEDGIRLLVEKRF